MVAINQEFAGGLDLHRESMEFAVCHLPGHLPVQRLCLFCLVRGDDRFIVIADQANRLHGILAQRISTQLEAVVADFQFEARVTRCSVLEGMLGVDFAMVTFDAAVWMTGEVRAALDIGRQARALLSGKVAE